MAVLTFTYVTRCSEPYRTFVTPKGTVTYNYAEVAQRKLLGLDDDVSSKKLNEKLTPFHDWLTILFFQVTEASKKYAATRGSSTQSANGGKQFIQLMNVKKIPQIYDRALRLDAARSSSSNTMQELCSEFVEYIRNVVCSHFIATVDKAKDKKTEKLSEKVREDLHERNENIQKFVVGLCGSGVYRPDDALKERIDFLSDCRASLQNPSPDSPTFKITMDENLFDTARYPYAAQVADNFANYVLTMKVPASVRKAASYEPSVQEVQPRDYDFAPSSFEPSDEYTIERTSLVTGELGDVIGVDRLERSMSEAQSGKKLRDAIFKALYSLFESKKMDMSKLSPQKLQNIINEEYSYIIATSDQSDKKAIQDAAYALRELRVNDANKLKEITMQMLLSAR